MNNCFLKRSWIIFVYKLWQFLCSRVNLTTHQVKMTQGQMKEVLFCQNLNHLQIFGRFSAHRDTFFYLSSFQLSLTEALGKNNLFIEQANLFFPFIVDWLCNDREQVIKEKYRKRGLCDFLHFTLACSPSSGRPTSSCCRIIPMSVTPSVSVQCLSLPLSVSSCHGRHWSTVSRGFCVC